MSLMTDAIERLRALLFRGRMDRDMDEELRFHLERETQERMRAGHSAADAARGARIALGIEETRDAVRDARGIGALERVSGDARFALRALRRNPGFTAAAVLVLGIAIGACTTVFSVVDAVLIADLPYPDADRLVTIHNQNSPTNIWNISTVDYQAIRDRQRTMDAFGAIARSEAGLSGAGAPQNIRIGRVTAGFFRALSVVPAAGRLITEADEDLAAPPVVVLSHALAGQAAGGSGTAVGRTIMLDGVSHTVIGVLQPGINELAGARAAAWPALRMPAPTRRGPFWMRGVGRLREGMTLEDARNDLRNISVAIFDQWAAGFRDSTARITPFALRERMIGTSGRQIGLFAAAVIMVLLVAVANVATLMLVRASARSGELSVRAALGAGRHRLVGLVITESLLLTLLAGLVGVAVTLLGIRLVPVVAPTLPRIAGLALDLRAVGAAGILTLISGLLVSIAPVSMVRTGAAIRADERRTGTSRGTTALRGALVTAEFALALPLLLGACLLLNSFMRLQRVDPGYDPAGIMTVAIGLPAARYPDSLRTGFWTRAEALMRAIPGVRGAGFTTSPPPDNPQETTNFNLKDRPVPDGTSEPITPFSDVSAGYFDVMNIRLIEGRTFTAGDTMPNIIVSRAWANRYYPGESPIGREVAVGGCWDCPSTIIGVVDDVKYSGLAGESDMMYGLIGRRTSSGFLMVRGESSGRFAAELGNAIHGLDPELPMTAAPLADRLGNALADPRRWTAILSSFAGAAVVLAALGVFALMSFMVRQRRREIGVRIALGAEPASVTRMIVARGMRYAALGTVIGFVLAVVQERWLRGLLFGVAPTDPLTLGVAAFGILLAALLASWLPGRRAARIHPIEAISSD